MIRFEQVSVRYPGGDGPVLSGVDLHVARGELVPRRWVARGQGKSTLLKAVNGLVPHFTGGLLYERVTVGGRDTRDHRPRDLADLVGCVGPDPLAGFVTDTVEEELAYGMEWLGVRSRRDAAPGRGGPRRARAWPGSRNQALVSLSDRAAQRVAIGSVLTAAPSGPRARRADLGPGPLGRRGRARPCCSGSSTTSESPSSWPSTGWSGWCSTPTDVVVVPGTRPAPVVSGDPADVMGHRSRGAARRAARRAGRLVAAAALGPRRPTPGGRPDGRASRPYVRRRHHHGPAFRACRHGGAAPVVRLRQGRAALREVDLRLRGGEVVALMGRNGAGKSTLLAGAGWACARPTPARSGQAPAPGRPGATRAGSARESWCARSAWCPQEPGDLLYADTVADECAQANCATPGCPLGGGARGASPTSSPGVDPATHPRDLSEGQRLTGALRRRAGRAAAARAARRADAPAWASPARERLGEVLRGPRRRRARGAARHPRRRARRHGHRPDRRAGRGRGRQRRPVARGRGGPPAFAPQVAKVLAPSADGSRSPRSRHALRAG